jgi:predicted nucleic acid-binding protein
MVYFDTNVLIYAFAKNIDDNKQGEISTLLVEEALNTETLIVSEITLCEFAFVSAKMNENKNDIDDNLEFLSLFLQPSNIIVNQRVLEILKNKSLYISSFDIFHLAFAEYHNVKLVTFDKGFNKLHAISKVEIDIQ